jgi:hypothetical protein
MRIKTFLVEDGPHSNSRESEREREGEGEMVSKRRVVYKRLLCYTAFSFANNAILFGVSTPP